MSLATWGLRTRGIGRWVFLIAPLASFVLLQAYIMVPGRPYLWARVKKNQLACVIEGPMTPFGRSMFIGALPRSVSGSSLVRPVRVGVFFVDRLMAILNQGFGFEPSGELYLRLNKRKIWSVDPWGGKARLVAVIEAQDPISDGMFSSNEFCVAGDTVWFETFDREGYDALFLQEGDTVVEVFRRTDLFRILGCSRDTAYVAWEMRRREKVAEVTRKDNRTILLECPADECNLRYGTWRPRGFLYLRKYNGSNWFNLNSLGCDQRVLKEGRRRRGLFGSGSSLFFLTYELEHEDGARTLVEELSLKSGRLVENYWVYGNVALLAEQH